MVLHPDDEQRCGGGGCTDILVRGECVCDVTFQREWMISSMIVISDLYLYSLPTIVHCPRSCIHQAGPFMVQASPAQV